VLVLPVENETSENHKNQVVASSIPHPHTRKGKLITQRFVLNKKRGTYTEREREKKEEYIFNGISW
jgi:hypothetical protein